MSVRVDCRELGMGCDFVAEGETAEEVLDSLMRHVQGEHAEDWYEIEEIYQAAREIVHERAA